MKTNKLLFFSAISFALCGCSEEYLPVGGNESGVPVKVNVSLPDASTRTELTETEGMLHWQWSEDDKLVLTDASGVNVGTLNLTGFTNDDHTAATFEGTVSGSLSNGEHKLNVIYTGGIEHASMSTSLPIALNVQDGDFNKLKTRDIVTSTVTVNKNSNYCLIPDFSMSHYLSAGKFKLVFSDDESVQEAVKVESVTISGINLCNEAQLNAGTLAWTSTEGAISVDPAKKEFYLTLAPASDLQMQFTAVTSDGKTFKGYLGDSEDFRFSLKEGVYLRRDLGAGYADPSDRYVALPIRMKESTDISYPGYENEDPRNPLHKFAKFNLTREEGLTNRFTASETENGALYQWGRNYGYVSTKGFYANSVMIDGSQWEINEKYANFIDAMGEMHYDQSTRCYGIMDYCVYTTTGQYNNCSITCGTAMHHSDLFYFDEPTFYSSVEDIKNNPTRYFMDGTPGSKVRGYGTYLFGMDELNNKADYWVSSFGDGGDTWTERAEACGYMSTNPCPDGWRLPSEEEMRAIAPENGLDSTRGYLSNMLSGYSELRQLSNGIRYAIRWIYNTDYITIEAVVVDDTITNKSQITSLFWDQNKDSKVVRYFPFTGLIRPFIGACDTDFNQSVYICRPHHFGLADFGAWPLTVGWYNYTYGVVGPADAGNFNTGFGGYWVAEKGKAFKFATRDKASSLAYSCILVENAEPVMAYAIRPVMDL